MNKSQHSHFDQETEARIARFGLRVGARLSEQSEQLPADISERLRFAREQAMQRLGPHARAPEAATEVTLNGGTTMALRGGPAGNSSPRWLKLASLTPLLLLLAGLLLIQHSQWYQQIQAAAEVDTALLSKPLPPAAYNDPGFREYLDEEQE